MVQKSFQLTPSILNLNVFQWEQQLLVLQEHGVTMLHYDVMDYHFVPNLSFGASLLSDIKTSLSLLLSLIVI